MGYILVTLKDSGKDRMDSCRHRSRGHAITWTVWRQSMKIRIARQARRKSEQKLCGIQVKYIPENDAERKTKVIMCIKKSYLYLTRKRHPENVGQPCACATVVYLAQLLVAADRCCWLQVCFTEGNRRIFIWRKGMVGPSPQRNRN